ncbi:unnamed protein product, partial [Rotaria sp. Silwood2]
FNIDLNSSYRPGCLQASLTNEFLDVSKIMKIKKNKDSFKI